MRPVQIKAGAAFCFLGGTALLLLGTTALAATFSIPNGDVAGLKTAITVANSNGQDDTIELASNGAYILTTTDNSLNGLPQIGGDSGHSLIIQGNGATIQRSTDGGTPSFRVLYINAGVEVTILDLTISNGLAEDDAGGGISNDGDVTVKNCLISAGNATFGGGIFNSGSLLVSHCVLSGNSAADGGGISNIGQVTIRNSTFSENSANTDIGGGAIYNEAEDSDASMDIGNSTFSGNSAQYGGAICNYALGFGHIFVTLTNSTLSDNSAAQGGGIFNRDSGNGDSVAFLQVTNDTFRANTASSGGAICNDVLSGATSAKIANTILSAGVSGGNLSAHPITSQGHNLCSDNGGGYFNATGDQINTDPKLDPAGLQNNGGPTQTIALLLDSSAIDAGNDATSPASDQRYYLRAGVSDIGAFEFGGTLAPATVVSRKTHAGAGTFDIDLPLTGNHGIECRSGGASGDHQLLLTFASPVSVSGTPQAEVTSGTGQVGTGGISNGGAVSVIGAVVTIPLTNVSNAQTIVITLFGVTDGTNTINLSVAMDALTGDTTGDGSVNSADIGQTKSQSGNGVSSSNFRQDVTVDGNINSADIGLVKSKSGTALP